MKRALLTFLITLSLITSASETQAKNAVKMRGNINQDFTIAYRDLPDELELKITESKTIPDIISIPENSLVKLEVIKAQRELRWHKSGLILCKLISYTPEVTDVPVDVSDKDIYLCVRKYEPIDKKEATLIGAELVIFQGAAFFAPGVDVGYYFIKGAIQRKKHPNWFKAGVSNAYDNSIFWFCLKGKPIRLEEGEQVQIKNIKTKKVQKMMHTIDKRNARFERQAQARILKKDEKKFKKSIKQEQKMADCSTVERILDNITINESTIAEH